MKKMRFFLLMLGLLLLITSCTSQSDGSADTEAESVPVIAVAENGASSYTIVHSDYKNAYTKGATELRRQVREITGVDLPITTDWEKNGTSDYEIVVGDTTREGTFYDAIDRAPFYDDGYTIFISGTRIVITGNGEEGTINGVNRFISDCVTADGIFVPENYTVTVNHEFPVKSLTIDGEDISAFQIVYDAGSTSSIRTAAETLQEYLYEACGIEPEIVVSSECTGKRIYLKASDEDTESFSCVSDNDGITITGGETRGLLYGAYDFLERYVGVRFLTSDTTYILDNESISLTALDYSYSPYFEYRDAYWYSYFDADIASKRMINSSNSRNIPENLGGSYGYTGSFVHTLSSLAGCDPTTQPCLSDESVYETVLANVFAILEENPDAQIISVSQNDNQNYCTCEACAAVDEEEGSHAGTLIRFVNRIADAVAEKYPNVAIHTLAYQYTRQAPAITKPRDNVIIQLCTIECCFNHALDDDSCEKNAALKADIEAWSKICNRIYVWDYTTNFMYYAMPFPNFDIIRENVLFFYEHNVRGLFEQGNYQGKSGEFGELRAYLLSCLMKNPYMTEEEYSTCMNEFLEGYYGAGWENIRSYIDFLTEAADSRGNHFGIYADYATTYGPLAFSDNADQLRAWFDAAEAAAETQEQLDHVRCSRICCDVVLLSQEYDARFFGSDEEKASLLEDVEELWDTMTEFGIRPRESHDVLVGDTAPANTAPIEWAN